MPGVLAAQTPLAATTPAAIPLAATSSNAAASVRPRWRRSMPSPCLLPGFSCAQDTDRDRKRTDRETGGPAYQRMADPDRVAVVTGASSGIGEATARGLVGAGFS